MASPGRNELCPCGSGRKFKHCCLQAFNADDTARTRLRTAEGVLVPALFAYAADEFGDEFFFEAWEEFFLWDSVPDEVADSREFGTTFDPLSRFGSAITRSSRRSCTRPCRRSRTPMAIRSS